jgi:endonuclease/exonuclease/phosphatase (EEP) superfamily protein YafD
MDSRPTRGSAARWLGAVATWLTAEWLGFGQRPERDEAANPVASVLGRMLAALLRLLGVATALFTLTGFLGRFWWAFDSTSHFRAQYLAGAVVLAVAQALCRRWRWTGFAVALVAVNAAVLVSHTGLFPTATATVSADAPSFRAVLLNVRTNNREFGRVRDFLRETRPDFAVLEEIDAVWQRELEPLRDLFPHTLAEPRGDNFGIILLSRHPLAGARVVQLGDAGVPSVFARVTIGGKELTVLGTHPLPPGGREYSDHRNRQLVEIAHFLAAQSGPLVLLGDLNTTPWNFHFQRLLTDSGLRNSAAGRGYQASWPATPFYLRIPIDHCLHSPELRVLRRAIGPTVGSDHLPVVVDFALP